MLLKWLAIGLNVKRWLAVLIFGIASIALGFVTFIIYASESKDIYLDVSLPEVAILFIAGSALACYSVLALSRSLIAPYRRLQQGRIVDIVYAHNKRKKGLRVVAIGGGTGLPTVLRGLKSQTGNITAVVTVADDGGSSGKLRREMGVLPPGDMRNNIAALADDESLMTKLFQYRFENGDLNGHSFGNLFIAALAGVSGGMEYALPEVERVLNIQGRVLPATLDDVHLVAKIRRTGKTHAIRIQGESKISEIGGQIEELAITPEDVRAYHKSVTAILEADLIVIGPGSLYTSIIPNLLVSGIAQAMRESSAFKVYICNIATQPGETTNYSVADHIVALERHIGRGVFQAVLANNAMPVRNAGRNTVYVQPAPNNHEILQRYAVHYTDLTEVQRPWRHDPQKLAEALHKLYLGENLNPISDSAAQLEPV